ncbi:MAG TPA: hypothetical protein VKF81_05730, partial [Blastocatellia bacterium]|nr:hypothetical protein [Blastocatellia bacterium]
GEDAERKMDPLANQQPRPANGAKSMFRFAVWKVAIAYVIGMWLLLVYGISVAGGGHGFLLPLALYFVLGLPLSALAIVADVLEQTRSGPLTMIFLMLAPLTNVGLFYLARWLLRQRESRATRE